MSICEFCKLSELDVSNKINSLKCGKSAGHDGIQDKFLKMGGENLAKMFAFQQVHRHLYISYDYENGRNLPSL